jgi:tetratricopeptide (TPR) repeat protein
MARRSTPALPPSAIPSLLIVGVVLACFWPALGNGFVNLDDYAMLHYNPHARGLGGAQLGWMFTTFHLGHYQPLAWVTLGIDHLLWGLDARGYHLTSLALHAANAVLVYALALAVWRAVPAAMAHPRAAATLAALLFAIHPLRVESVAWVTERRDVLSGFFLLLATLAWLRLHAAGTRERARVRWYALSLFSFALSLLSKAWGMTFPVVLLVLDVWPLGRLDKRSRSYASARQLLWEKLPFAALAFATAVTALFAVRSAGATTAWTHLTPLHRGMQAAYGLCFYVRKTLLPIGLFPAYLLDRNMDPSEPVYVLSAIGVLVAIGVLFALRRRWPGLVVAFVCYVIIVSPVLGLTQSGIQIVADRYAYLSCLPFALLVAAGFGRVPSRGLTGRVAAAAGLLVVAALGALTWQQTLVWRDTLTLWNHTLRHDPENWFAYSMRGTHYQQAGDHAHATADYDAAIARNQYFPQVFNNRAAARAAQGDLEGAYEDWGRALEANPRFFEALYNRGVTRLSRGDARAAVDDFEAAVRLKPAAAPPGTSSQGRARRSATSKPRSTPAGGRCSYRLPNRPCIAAPSGCCWGCYRSGDPVRREQVRVGYDVTTHGVIGASWGARYELWHHCTYPSALSLSMIWEVVSRCRALRAESISKCRISSRTTSPRLFAMSTRSSGSFVMSNSCGASWSRR